jgi:hypothetical protein
MDAICLRVEPATTPPSTTASAAIDLANGVYPAATFARSCWSRRRIPAPEPPPNWPGWSRCRGRACRGLACDDRPGPRAIVIVDAISGKFIASHALG